VKKNTLENWGHATHRGIYADKDNNNFSSTGHLVPDHPLKEGFGEVAYWKTPG